MDLQISTDTKVIARLHTQANSTGLNIYNPYFQDQGINAVYLLFQNEKPDPLVEGIRNLNLAGAITAGFEHDPTLPKLVDESTKAAYLSGRVGLIANSNGVLKAHYQGGEGLLSAIQEKVDIAEKRIVIVGSGTVANTLVLAMQESEQKPDEVHIYNRSQEKAEELKGRFDLVSSANTLDQLYSAEGDILVNASRIGSKAPDEYFTADIVKQFKAVADVTFGVELTNLTEIAKQNELTVITGWDMFTHHAAVVLKHILNHDTNIERLRHFVREGLATNNHGAIAIKK